MDWLLTHRSNGLLARHDGWEDAISGYEHLGEALFVLVLLVLLVLGGRRLRRAGVAGGASVGAAVALAQVVSRLVDRPRPFVAHPDGVHLFARHAADAGFPSDHATAAFAIAAAVFVHDRRWGGGLLGLAALLAAGRVAIGVHYPSDVLAGAALGSGVALALTHGVPRRWLDGLADRFEDRPAFRAPVRQSAPR